VELALPDLDAIIRVGGDRRGGARGCVRRLLHVVAAHPGLFIS
jgi:hypothetical protein